MKLGILSFPSNFMRILKKMGFPSVSLFIFCPSAVIPVKMTLSYSFVRVYGLEVCQPRVSASFSLQWESTGSILLLSRLYRLQWEFLSLQRDFDATKNFLAAAPQLGLGSFLRHSTPIPCIFLRFSSYMKIKTNNIKIP